MNKAQLAATNEAIAALGGLSATAKRYRITANAVQQWRTRGVPLLRLKQVEKDSGIARRRLRPLWFA